MKTVALDTNILLDYFLERPVNKRSFTLMKQAQEGSLVLFLPLPVILEFEWTSRTYYKISKQALTDRIFMLLSVPNCLVEDKKLLFEALDLYQKSSGVSFDDCLIVLMAKKAKTNNFVTSDRALQKLWKKL
ncbi:MAG: PIN domain-containing protein [Patescibacteria group bacterium]